MKISVLIPTYNSSAFIRATLDSVLQQTLEPYEILVLDDGSTDKTLSILNSYTPRINVYHQENEGVCSASNKLCQLARGELIAFLDHDDIWHPSYLEVQSGHFKMYPEAAALRTGHLNFYGYGNYYWENMDNISFKSNFHTKVFAPFNFFKLYNEAPGPFQTMSCLCVPKSTLIAIGKAPFSESVKLLAGDSYFVNLIATLGPLIYTSLPLVAYRIIKESLSANRLKVFGANVHAFELLENHYNGIKDLRLKRAFSKAFASKRRVYAKILMGARLTSDARSQLWLSIKNSITPMSLTKSLALLLLTYLPKRIQPTYPLTYRE
jgi:glycosyltransferase involved in cell wall biosynthesis